MLIPTLERQLDELKSSADSAEIFQTRVVQPIWRRYELGRLPTLVQKDLGQGDCYESSICSLQQNKELKDEPSETLLA
jgi:hypothetical protein